MPRANLSTLADLVARGLQLRVWCLWCARGERADPGPVLARFRARGWAVDLRAARRRFRCARCGQGEAILLLPARAPRRVPVPAEPTFPDLPPRTAPMTPEEAVAGRKATEQLVGGLFRMFKAQAKRDRVVAGGEGARATMRRALRSRAEREAWIARLRATRRAKPRLDLIVNRRLGRGSRGDRLTAAVAALDDRPMCNRYQVRTAHAEAVQLKLGMTPERGLNYAGEVYPGYTGLVIAADAAGEPAARAMTWGFPLALRGKQGQLLKPRPVNNAREDKLGGPFWRSSFETRRCLIPASAWAEAEGEKGKMTCTWHALPPGADGEAPPMVLAGLWRPTEEWGDAYAMVMVDGCPQMAEVHDRMPVVLRPEHWHRWLTGSPAEAMALCETWPGDLAIDRTATLWAARD